MKVLSLTQPWAEAVRLRIKRFETRGRRINYRGKLAIHATKERFDPRNYDPAWVRLLADMGIVFEELDYGAVICIATLCADLPTDTLLLRDPLELALGDFSAGRRALRLADVRVLKNPIPMRGHQMLFDWPSNIPQPADADFVEVIA